MFWYFWDHSIISLQRIQFSIEPIQVLNDTNVFLNKLFLHYLIIYIGIVETQLILFYGGCNF